MCTLEHLHIIISDTYLEKRHTGSVTVYIFGVLWNIDYDGSSTKPVPWVRWNSDDAGSVTFGYLVYSGTATTLDHRQNALEHNNERAGSSTRWNSDNSGSSTQTRWIIDMSMIQRRMSMIQRSHQCDVERQQQVRVRVV